MNQKEKLALFLGMLSGDGCLPIKHNGEGYRDYAVQFYNTNKKIVLMFNKLFLELFGVHGKIRVTKRKNKKDLWEFCKYSKKIVKELKAKEFPEGVKKDILKIPEIIKQGTLNEKREFIIGFLITDGCLRKKGDILFHSGSKQFLIELANLINEITCSNKSIKEYTQREKFKSYQLNLNKKETDILLSEMPTWDNGTPAALSFLINHK